MSANPNDLRYFGIALTVVFSASALLAQAALGPIFPVKVLTPNGKTPDMPAAEKLFRAELHASVVPMDSAAEAGIVILKPPASVSASRFGTALDDFIKKTPGIFQQLLVRTASGELTIPTGRIVVQFEETVNDEQARLALSKFKLRIVQEPSKFRPTRYVVEAGSSDTDPIALAKKIAADPAVSFAEPDLLSISAVK